MLVCVDPGLRASGVYVVGSSDVMLWRLILANEAELTTQCRGSVVKADKLIAHFNAPNNGAIAIFFYQRSTFDMVISEWIVGLSLIW